MIIDYLLNSSKQFQPFGVYKIQRYFRILSNNSFYNTVAILIIILSNSSKSSLQQEVLDNVVNKKYKAL